MTIPPVQATALPPDKIAAHNFLSELRTRVAVQNLPYQYGDEVRALESLVELFNLARQAVKDNPGCEDFARCTTQMLNVDLRPVTAKWHRAHKAGLLDSRDGADEFRADLKAIQVKLKAFALKLQEMAYGTSTPDAETPPAISPEQVEALFRPLTFGILHPVGHASVFAEINRAEAAEIAKRRVTGAPDGVAGQDAVGLALSGGGIRSATFCAGVLQVLTARKLLGQVDYLSTVSGGGYTGSFITSWIGQDGDLDHLANPHGPDTDAFRHVRQHAKYLSAANQWERWRLLIRTLAGMLLNWTVPFSILAFAACLSSLGGTALVGAMDYVAGLLAIVTGVVLLPWYGVSLRDGRAASRAGAWLAGFAGATVVAFVVLLVERGCGFVLGPKLGLSAASVASLTAALPAAVRFLPKLWSPRLRKTIAEVVVLAAGLAVPVLALAVFYLLRQIADLPPVPGASILSPIQYFGGLVLVASIGLVTGLFALFGLDINATSPHKLYRDALAATFLKPKNSDDDEEPLDSVNGSGGAPYHLINATVNLPSSTNPVLKDRRGDFFLFSKHWTGSLATGYRQTGNWKIDRNKIGLATAMAISGAAASPHMGLGSRPTLTALMTLLNIRLGVWVPHPDRIKKKTPGFACLLREMTGAGMSETSPWLDLTDGGHIENLGIYELLRRRCKFIVSIDGEADPKLTFQGNLTLVRHAQIDFGIRIEPRLDDLRLNAQGFSRSHAQLFKINYPAQGGQPAAVGLLLYLKLSMTGNEAELLKRYRLLHPDFPHQSTADQFYDEEQFEAYRQLGVHVAEGVFSPALLTSNQNPKTISEWFRQLAENMLTPAAA